MDDRHDNITSRDRSRANGRYESQKNGEEQAVFARLFALDQQPDPSPEFVARLGNSLMPSAGRMTLLSATTLIEETGSAPDLQVVASGGGKRRRPFISFGSAAVLMVIVVLIGYVVTLWAVNDSGDHPASMALASTFEATNTAASENCFVEPLDIVQVNQLLTFAVYGIPQDAEFQTPTATADTSTGTPPAEAPAASEETGNRVWEVFEQYWACRMINDSLRMYALFTDDGIARTLAPDGIVNFYRVAALGRAPTPGSASAQYFEMDRVEQLPDGRVVLYLRDPAGRSETALETYPEAYVIFREIDGHWKIDDTFIPLG